MRAFYLLLFTGLFCATLARVSDQYCGNNNCYEILNVTQDASQAEIKKSYRSLSLKYHPDKNLDTDTTAIYREINRAYEILSNEEIRKAYNEYLENPNQSEYYQYYRYYQAKYAPQVDPRLVLGLFVTLFSVFQYVSRKTMYNSAVAYVEKTTKFQTMVNDRLKEEKARNSNVSKEDIIAEIRKSVQIHGGYSIPKIKDLLFFQIILLPYTIGKWIYGTIRWIVLFNIMKRPYGPEERIYLTRRQLGMNEKKWMMVPADERESLVRLELWNKENMKQYMKDMKEKQREMYGDNAKYKQYQRYLKNKKR